MPKYCVIVPAAGKAERFGGAEKKTFAKIDGRAVFLRSLEHFINRPDVCQTILAVAPEDVATVKTTYGPNLGFMGIKLVEGGARRCDTIAAALKIVSADAEYVAIHDAARPCVTTEMIDAVFAEAVKSAAAILAAPVVGTVKLVSAARVIEKTVDRSGLYEAQTPQVFRKDVILTAYAKLASDPTLDPTDDAELVEQSGHAVSVVVADASNLKITTKGDLTLAGAIIRSRPARTVPRMGAFEEAKW